MTTTWNDFAADLFSDAAAQGFHRDLVTSPAGAWARDCYFRRAAFAQADDAAVEVLSAGVEN